MIGRFKVKLAKTKLLNLKSEWVIFCLSSLEMNIYLSNIKEKEEKEREKDVTFRKDLKIKILKVFPREIIIL